METTFAFHFQVFRIEAIQILQCRLLKLGARWHNRWLVKGMEITSNWTDEDLDAHMSDLKLLNNIWTDLLAVTMEWREQV